MKTFTLVSSLLAAAYAAPAPEQAIGEARDVTQAAPVPIDNPLMRSTEQGVKVLPRMSMTEPKDGAKRTTVKYGNWMVSSTKMMSTIKLAQGPCGLAGCYVTAMEATIRYPDGKEANVDTNAWLHHIALFGTGGGGGSIWAAGNERPTLRLNTGSKYGFDFPSAFMLMIDLMTEDVKPKNLTLEITYEHVPRTTPGYKAATMYWLTIGEPAAKTGKYSFSTMPSIVSGAGQLLYSIGHMHDGGDNMSLYVGGNLVCKSVMHYNSRAGYGKDANGAADEHAGMAGMAGMAGAKGKAASGSTAAAAMPKTASGGMVGHSHTKRQHAHGGGGGLHISDPGACTDFGTVTSGQSMKATAFYDAGKYGLMEHNGAKERLMGNMRVYIGPTSTGLFG
ncbi:hypothetical protein BT63DRAFT_451567 [Microthyrium microscopicum]|uniref:Uncharacterized protein n=1 Tax=Microthyrium microscopicum TaxID=703497 RepID=A0A6A6UR28_9PEZI|nr:hypothetical protein BT63DRAFT_451567 [Microthyrium microscopicum]